MRSSLPSVTPRVSIKDNKVDHIQSFDSDNNYPGRILDIIKASGTATSCTNLYAKFINGGGFKDQKFWKARVNRKGLTVDKLLRLTSRDFSKFKGFAIHVNYNAMFQINEVSYVPFDHCRLGLADDNGYVSKIAVYDDWECKRDSRIKRDKIDYINVWNPSPDIIFSQINAAGGIENYKGQIFWYSNEEDAYPLSSIDPVIEDCITDAGIKKYRQTNIEKGFFDKTIIEYPYEFESEEEREEEKENLKTFQGAEGSRIMMVENKNAAETPIKINQIGGDNTDKMFSITNRTVKDSIIENFTQPPVLLGVAISGKLGTADEIRDAYMFYNSVTSDERRVFEESFFEIFSRYRNPINISGDYSIIPLSFNNPTPVAA